MAESELKRYITEDQQLVVVTPLEEVSSAYNSKDMMVLETDSVASTLLFSVLDQVKVYDSNLVSLSNQINAQFAATRKDLQSIELQLQSALNEHQSTKLQFEQQLKQIQGRLADSYNDLDHVTNLISSKVDAVEHSLQDKRTLELKVEEKVIALEQKIEALNRKSCTKLDSADIVFNELQNKLDKLINVIVPSHTASLRRSESISQREDRRKCFLQQISDPLHTEQGEQGSASSTSSGYRTMSKQTSSTHSKILESKFESIDDDLLHKLCTEDTLSQQAYDVTDREADTAHTVVEVLWAIEDLIGLLKQLPLFTSTDI